MLVLQGLTDTELSVAIQCFLIAAVQCVRHSSAAQVAATLCLNRKDGRKASRESFLSSSRRLLLVVILVFGLRGDNTIRKTVGTHFGEETFAKSLTNYPKEPRADAARPCAIIPCFVWQELLKLKKVKMALISCRPVGSQSTTP